MDGGVPVCFFCFPKKFFESVQVGWPLREQVVVRGACLLPIFNDGQDAGCLAGSPLAVLSLLSKSVATMPTCSLSIFVYSSF